MLSSLPVEIQLMFVLIWSLNLGSFLNVVIVRLPRGKSIVTPSSRCGWCRSPLKIQQNLPLFGYLLSRGQCKKCATPFSARYLWIELLAVVLCVAVWSIYGWTLLALAMSAFALTLLAISFIDLEFKIIPDELSLGGWTVALFLAAFAPSHFRVTFFEALVGGFVGFGFFWLISRIYALVRREEGLGFGDVKLMGFVGAVLGVQGVVTTVFVGALLGSIVGLFFVLVRKKTRHFPIPFGPFLAMGSLVALFNLDGWFWG